MPRPIKGLPPTILRVLFVAILFATPFPAFPGSWGSRVGLICNVFPQDGRLESVVGHPLNPRGKGKWICEVEPAWLHCEF